MLHFLIIFIFNIPLTPRKESPERQVQISFYGPILAELGRMEDKREEISEASRLDKRLRFLLADKMSGSGGISYAREIFYARADKPQVTLSGAGKTLPPLRKDDADSIKLPGGKSRAEKKSVLDNLIFSNPSFLDIGYRRDEENFNFRMRILVSWEGKVEFVEPLFFSGRPELDILVKKTVKEWSLLPYGNSSGWFEIRYNPRLVSAEKNMP